MTRVSARARRHEDRAGDPLDGLVNMFDVGIVLAVAFLIAALASLDLTGTLTRHGLTRPASDLITVAPSDTVATIPPNGAHTIGRGSVVGKVYLLPDGRLVYVVPKSLAPTPSPSPSPS
jgi:hypothetical protein